ncbi:diguanylate cyclase [Dethiothermospora halolimnae]|uniref:sensor domain-containing diguanylate cyclase n=1 Tax=Dethiothermospora halolimnae TaxID=3114390 RepID=UPI003CCB9B99
MKFETIPSQVFNCPKHLQNIIDMIPNPIYFKDIKGVYKYCNETFLEYFDVTKEQVIGHRAMDLMSMETAKKYEKFDRRLIKNGGKGSYNTTIKLGDGSYRYIKSNKVAIRDNNGKIIGVAGVAIDITEQKIIEKNLNRQLKSKEAMLSISQSIVKTKNIYDLFDLILKKTLEVVENAQVGSVLLIDEKGRLDVVSQIGFTEEDVENFSIVLEDTFIWKKTNGKIEESIIVNDIEDMMGKNYKEPLKNKEGFYIRSSITAPIIIDNRLYGIINIDSEDNDVFDDMDLKLMEYMKSQIEIAIGNHKLYEDVVSMSMYDKLTNIYNRNYFEKYIEDKLDNCKCGKTFSLAIFDLNELKPINDRYGHIVGDLTIKYFAKKLKNSIRNTDVLARVGGDEFVAVLLESKKEDLIKKFESLQKFFRKNPLKVEGNKIVCSFSYGIADYPTDGTDYETLIKMADKNMYRYKRNIKKN